MAVIQGYKPYTIAEFNRDMNTIH